MSQAHEIDYRIIGEEMQYVEIELDPSETAIAEAGSFMMMDDGVQMQTIFGDGSQQQQGVLSPEAIAEFIEARNFYSNLKGK